jgi:ABC-2 type transport system permease protein
VVSNSGLIKKVYFPRMHLPLSVATSTGFTWGNEMLLLALVLLLCGSFVLPWLPLVLFVMVLLGLFAVGLAMVLAIANVHFRDMQHFTAIILQMWMYLTPIIYPVSLVERGAEKVGDWVLVLYRLNPMERFVAVFRNLLYDNRWPEVGDMLACVAWALGMFAVGFLVFSKNEKRLAELL